MKLLLEAGFFSFFFILIIIMCQKFPQTAKYRALRS